MPYKNKHAKAEQMRRYRKLRQLRTIDSHFLMRSLADAEDKPILVRAVGMKFEEDNPKATGKYTAHLSSFAISKYHYRKLLEEMDFPYTVEPGHFYFIRKATDEEVQRYLDERGKTLQKSLSELLKAREK